MEKKTKIQAITNDLGDMIGNGVKITGFSDSKDRMAYPVCLEELSSFMECIMVVDMKQLWINFTNPELAEYVKKIFVMTFKDESVLKAVNGKNYPEIFDKILDLNGINIKDKEEQVVDGENPKQEV